MGEADCKQLRRAQDAGGIVFQAHPRLHGLPWSVPDSVANRHVLLAITKQFRGARFGIFIATHSAGAPGRCARECMAKRSFTADTTGSMGPWPSAHGVSSLGRVSSSRTAITSLPCRTNTR